MSSPVSALGGATPFGPEDYRFFQTRVEEKFGVRLRDYKSEQMHRRISMIAQRTEASSLREFVWQLERDPILLRAFRDEVTINVTEFLRNPRLFEQLAREVLPSLPKTSHPLSVWSAGCSYGAEAYSMAMVLHEFDPLAQFRIHGTDIDFSVIDRANTALFTTSDVRNVSATRRTVHLYETPDDRFTPKSHLRRRVTFSAHDLLGDDYPVESYDIVCCRNVVIYFTEEAKDRVFRGFYASLRPGGLLFVGGSERLANYGDIGFEAICPFFFRKP